MGHAVVGEGAEEEPGIEAGQDHHRAAGVELRLDRDAHGVLVEERPRDQRAVVGPGRPMPLRRADAPQHAVMGEPHALGATGRARRVGKEGDLTGRYRRRREAAGIGPVENRLVVEPTRRSRGRGDPRREPGLLHDRFDIGMAGGLDDRRAAARVGDDEADRVGGEPDVERERHDAAAHGAEERLDEFEPVADREQQALSGRDAEAAERRRHALHPPVEVAMGDLDGGLAREVHDGQAPARGPCRQPVEIAEVAVPSTHHRNSVPHTIAFSVPSAG